MLVSRSEYNETLHLVMTLSRPGDLKEFLMPSPSKLEVRCVFFMGCREELKEVEHGDSLLDMHCKEICVSLVELFVGQGNVLHKILRMIMKVQYENKLVLGKPQPDGW